MAQDRPGRDWMQTAAFSAFCAFALALAGSPQVALASPGTVDLSWNTCSGPGDRAITADNLNWLYVTVLGHSGPHLAYEVWIVVRDADGAIPDAWRFDAAGCQGPTWMTIDHLNPSESAGKTCPAFQGASQSLQIKSWQPAPPALGLAGQPFVGVLANSYPYAFLNPDPARRYFLARFLFDHTQSVPGTTADPELCGGLERGICFSLLPARTGYIDGNGVSQLFTIGRGEATANGGGCAPVPAPATTWGMIKAQYRR